MDLEKQKKHQSLKIIISEAIMVLTVIVTVVILAFIVSGYWINSDFEVERQGMLQISSVPTGATVDIDGDSSWLQRTNTSKVLSSGEHTVTLTKDGYDSWSKTIDIKEGLLYRLHYPRLFLNNRTAKNLLDTTSSATAIISSDHSSLLLTNNTTKWFYVDLKADELQPKSFDISNYFTSISPAVDSGTGLFTGKIIDADWDRDASHVLFDIQSDAGTEWVLLDVKNLDKSLNLTKEFGANFSQVEILDNSASNLLAVQNSNLHKIDIGARQVSAVLVENIINFDHYHNEVIFTAQNTAQSIAQNTTELSAEDNSADATTEDSTVATNYYLGHFKIGDNITKITGLSTPAQVVLSKFYDEKYITILSDTVATVYKFNDFTEFAKYELTFAPANIKVGHDGEFIIMSAGQNIATIDMEAGVVREWSVAGSNFDWLDNDMIYTVADGELIVYDFDGLNQRSLAKNVSHHFPAGITNNKWLYYFSDGNLMREVITD